MTCSPPFRPCSTTTSASTLGSGLDALDDGLAVLDHENINARLIGDECGLRHHDLLFGRTAVEDDLHELTIDQRAFRVRQCRADKDRVGRSVHRHVHEIDLADLVHMSSRRRSEYGP